MSEASLLELAAAYFENGWRPLMLPAGAKAPPPDDRTGYGGSDMTMAEIAAASWTGNIGLRMPDDVLGLDIDVYHGGDRTLDEMLARCGPLPPTWISHSNRNDGSGIRFYRVPPGMVWLTSLAGIEIIQRVHRYAVVYPSVHPDGRAYGWADQNEDRFTTELPAVDDLPELPWPWIAELSRARRADIESRSQAVGAEELEAFIEAHSQADQPSYAGTILAHFTERWQAGYSRHDTMQHCLIWAMECVRAGIAAGRPTLQQLGDLWVQAVSPDARRAQLHATHRTTEWEAMVRHAVGKVAAKPEAEMLRMHDEIAGIPMRPGPAPVKTDEPIANYQTELPAPINWTAFVERDETARTWLVEGFWPWGRAMALWAAAKTGKSELALWCAAKLALGEHPWTGDPIEPVDVAYFDFEMTEDDLDDRLAAFGIDPVRLDRLHYFLLPALHPLDVDTGGSEVEHLAVRYGAKAVVFDTFSRAVHGEEDKADTVQDFYRYTGSRLKRLGIGYIRTDHAGKDPTKGQRGSSAKRDDVDVVWSMRRDTTKNSAGNLILSCEGSSRLSWVGPHLGINRSEVNGVLTYSTTVRMGWPAGTAAKVKELDALGLPLDIGRPAARKALMEASLTPGRNEILAAALKYRRELKQNSGGQQLGISLGNSRGDKPGTVPPRLL